MAKSPNAIPPTFDEEFLDWFRERTEAAWAAIPERSPEEILTEYARNGAGGSQVQHGTRWLNGLSDQEIEEIERHWSLTFPPDYRLFLRRLHSLDKPALHIGYLPEGATLKDAPEALAETYVEQYYQYMVLEPGTYFYNWQTDAEAIQWQFAWLWEGLQVDIEYNDLWRQSWGPKPETLDERKQRVRELVEAAPRLIPVFLHRYLLGEPTRAGNLVLSVYQSDIVIYGSNLRNYLLNEFSGFGSNILGLDDEQHEQLKQAERANYAARRDEFAAIPFWGDIMGY